MTERSATIKKAEKGFRSLAVTLTAAFLMLTLAILMISTVLEIVLTFRNQRIVIAGQQELIAREAAGRVNNYIEERFNLLRVTGRLAGFLDAPLNVQKETIDMLLGIEPSFSYLALLDNKGNEVLHSSRKSRFTVYDQVTALADEAISVTGRGTAYISPVYIDKNSSEPMVTIAVPVNDVIGDFKGVLQAEVNLKFMWDLVGRIRIGRTGEAYVIDRAGNLIAANDISRVLKRENLSGLKEVEDFVCGRDPSIEPPAEISKGFKNTHVVSSYVRLGMPDWAVVTELPVPEAFKLVFDKIKISIGIAFLCFILAVFIGSYFSRRITRPIIILRNAAAKIGEGNFDANIEIGTADEIGDLARSFNRMTNDLRSTTTSIDNLNREIAERKKAEEELRRSEGALKGIFSAAPVGISVTRNRMMLSVNRHLCEITGYAEEDLVNSDARIFFGDEATYLRVGRDLYGNGIKNDHSNIEAQMKRKDGSTIDVLLTAAAIESTDQTVVTVTDITFLKEIQAQLRKKNIEILEFTNSVTHDLKKPLTAMKTIFDMAKKGAFGNVNNDAAEAIITVVDAANYMQEMLEDLMACARLETGTYELEIGECSFRELAETVIARLKYLCEEKRILTEIMPDDVAVSVDRKQLTRVLMNLVGNAVNYMGASPGKRIRIGWERRDGGLVFFVEDNGMGIPPESQKRLFQKFKRGSNVSGISGTGLGLYIVKGIVEAHGGKIWFESVEGKGTTFYFTLCRDEDCSSSASG